MADTKTVETWTALGKQLRVDSIRCTTAAGSGHPTSSMSAADIFAVLIATQMKCDWKNPKGPDNDRIVLSKGHAAPVLYAAFKALGVITDAELMALRKYGSRTEGHPTPELPFVDAATGSLGQGIGVAVGLAWSLKNLEKSPAHVFAILGDSEIAEGSVWEAFGTAWKYNLDNLIAIVDLNRLGQRGETAIGWHSEIVAARAKAFGLHVEEINGHDPAAIDRALTACKASGKPSCIVAKTEKGHGVSFLANKDGWHGKALSAEEATKAYAEIQAPSKDVVFSPPAPDARKPAPAPEKKAYQAPKYDKGSSVAPRKAYGDALTALGAAHPELVVLDAEVSNSTFADEFKHAFPDRFFESYIAEQLMVSVAQGVAARGKVTFASTFAAFLMRAADQVRMAAVSKAHLRLCGSHAGVSIGEDGPSQMALEDLAFFRSVNGSAVLYPSDGVSTVALVGDMAAYDGISYLRTTREKLPVLYGADEKFPIGGSKTLRSSGKDKATVIAAGITLHEALKAADELQKSGTAIRVIDLYSVKPVDVAALKKAVTETEQLVVVEDHWAQGGLGDAVVAALAEAGVPLKKFTHLCIREMPRSGKPTELLEHYGISAAKIVAAIK
jgi:transketolase